MNRPRIRMGLVLFFLIMVASPALAASPSSPQEWTGNANIFLGGKFLDSNDWAPAQDQIEFGLLLDARQRSWPLNLALDVMYGQGSDSGGLNFTSKILEIDFGARKIFDEIPAPFHPYIGFGLALTKVEATVSGIGSASGTGPGLWFEGGLYADLGYHFNLGADIRVSRTWVDVTGITVDGGGYHIGLITGYHW